MTAPRTGGGLVGLAAWRPRYFFDPVVRDERRRQRARRSLGVRGLVFAGSTYLATQVGTAPGPEWIEIGWGFVAGTSGLATAFAVQKMRRLQRTPRPLPVPPATAVPPASSLAHPPLSRLALRERALADLLGLLGAAAGTTAEEAREAAAALRGLGRRIVTLESACDGMPADAAEGLSAALAALRVRLDEGVSAYELVVAAAADAVTAQAEGRSDDAFARHRLEEAADGLAGLARGLREVRELR